MTANIFQFREAIERRRAERQGDAAASIGSAPLNTETVLLEADLSGQGFRNNGGGFGYGRQATPKSRS
jgi:hypothetical protein